MWKEEAYEETLLKTNYTRCTVMCSVLCNETFGTSWGTCIYDDYTCYNITLLNQYKKHEEIIDKIYHIAYMSDDHHRNMYKFSDMEKIMQVRLQLKNISWRTYIRTVKQVFHKTWLNNATSLKRKHFHTSVLKFCGYSTNDSAKSQISLLRYPES